MRNRVRFVALALASFVLSFLGSFFAPGAFLNRLTATALCSLLSFQSNACLAQLPRESERVVAAVSTPAAEKPSLNNDAQKVAGCFLGVCVNLPKIPILNPKAPNGNQPSPTASPQQPADGGQETPGASNNEKPATDLTGTWSSTGTIFTIDGRGCTAGYTGTFLINGKESQGFVFPIRQSGNQWTTPPVTTTSANGAKNTESIRGTITGNTVSGTDEGTVGGGLTVQSTGTVSADGNTVSGTSFCKTVAGPATANGTFTWTRKQPCARFQEMLDGAKDIQKLADKLATDDKAYLNAVIDIIIKGYNSPYAVYLWDVPSEKITEYFKDEQQIQAVRPQIIAHMRTKADNRKRFAEIGISGNYMPQTPVYAKENIDLFCSLDSSKFTGDFWDSLWMAGYIDDKSYKEIEEKLIKKEGRKKYHIDDLLTAIDVLLTVETAGFAFVIAKVAGKEIILSRLAAKNIFQELEVKEFPPVIAEEVFQLPPRLDNISLGMELNPAKNAVFRGGNSFKLKPGEARVNKENGLVKLGYGLSLNANPLEEVILSNGGAFQIESIPEGLKIIQRGVKKGTKDTPTTHFEIVPEKEMTVEQFQNLLNQVKVFNFNIP